VFSPPILSNFASSKERFPPSRRDYTGLHQHLILLARRGIYVIENLVLEDLAASGHRRFDFICTPSKFVGATGSPVKPVP
jgi:kynurenine formamidase